MITNSIARKRMAVGRFLFGVIAVGLMAGEDPAITSLAPKDGGLSICCVDVPTLARHIAAGPYGQILKQHFGTADPLVILAPLLGATAEKLTAVREIAVTLSAPSIGDRQFLIRCTDAELAQAVIGRFGAVPGKPRDGWRSWSMPDRSELLNRGTLWCYRSNGGLPVPVPPPAARDAAPMAEDLTIAFDLAALSQGKPPPEVDHVLPPRARLLLTATEMGIKVQGTRPSEMRPPVLPAGAWSSLPLDTRFAALWQLDPTSSPQRFVANAEPLGLNAFFSRLQTAGGPGMDEVLRNVTGTVVFIARPAPAGQPPIFGLRLPMPEAAAERLLAAWAKASGLERTATGELKNRWGRFPVHIVATSSGLLLSSHRDGAAAGWKGPVGAPPALEASHRRAVAAKQAPGDGIASFLAGEPGLLTVALGTLGLPTGVADDEGQEAMAHQMLEQFNTLPVLPSWFAEHHDGATAHFTGEGTMGGPVIGLLAHVLAASLVVLTAERVDDAGKPISEPAQARRSLSLLGIFTSTAGPAWQRFLLGPAQPGAK